MNKTKPSASAAAPASPTAAVQDIWRVGLDAFSQATQAATAAATQAASQVATLAATASVQPPSLEGLFEARVAKALGRLGTPTREEMDALSAQVQHLQSALQAALQALEAKAKKPAAPAKRKKTSG
jgi:BMFP domain-containing protein YqiC